MKTGYFLKKDADYVVSMSRSVPFTCSLVVLPSENIILISRFAGDNGLYLITVYDSLEDVRANWPKVCGEYRIAPANIVSFKEAKTPPTNRQKKPRPLDLERYKEYIHR